MSNFKGSLQAMRQHQYDFLITTTILERGVTFPKIDVGVLGADDGTFSASALVQIAGRVGRSVERPDGDVTFWVQERTKSVCEAQRKIKGMNRRGRQYQWQNVYYVRKNLNPKSAYVIFYGDRKLTNHQICPVCHGHLHHRPTGGCPGCGRACDQDLCPDCQHW